MARRIRVAGVPADFRVPRGWPTPTDRWIRANAFWVPPVDWTPLPEVPPAPHRWTFWTPNPLWNTTRAHVYSSLRVWTWVGVAGFVLGVLTRVWAFAGDPPREMLTAAGLVTFALLATSLIGYAAGHRRLTQRALAQHAVAAAEGRTQRLTREYQRYLLDIQ